ncbi:MAG: LysR substrate-binding domain-containing protein [Chthoniobacteraceae bacterium]
MELRSLQVLVEVIRQGGFTAAGKHVLLTQPSVSRQIKLLEDELGQVLLVRDRHAITLTDAGKIVYQRALSLLGETARLRAELDELAGLRRGELSLGVPPLAGMLFVPLIRAFKELYPAVELRLFESGSDTIEGALTSGEVEIGMLLQPVAGERFESAPIFQDSLALVVPPGSPWARKRSVPLAALKDAPLILFPEGFTLNDRIAGACRRAGFAPQITGRSGQPQFIAALVGSGAGVALLPHFVIRDMPGIAVVEIEDAVIDWSPALAWLRGQYLSCAGRALVELAKKEETWRDARTALGQ